MGILQIVNKIQEQQRWSFFFTKSSGNYNWLPFFVAGDSGTPNRDTPKKKVSEDCGEKSNILPISVRNTGETLDLGHFQPERYP